ncbi:phosphatidylinositol-specific phospholipase C/glycerophosphodiester phosphodiesterase family protein [Gorillibacterium sp. sgz5001074]|uniref:phosphatidylinositol-specific phospholipase C/glycerophosphodiester phosphodiesterase family protein n=1 Tax=Gorillibacterium sp. sgz5001074 TaxID=3446695 RepID=UPI003F6625E8
MHNRAAKWRRTASAALLLASLFASLSTEAENHSVTAAAQVVGDVNGLDNTPSIDVKVPSDEELLPENHFVPAASPDMKGMDGLDDTPSGDEKASDNEEVHPESHPVKAIAHALGGMDGYDYTNSIDAMAASYEAGFRMFETDLILTSDGRLAARHDWGAYLQPSEPEELADCQLSSEEFLSYKIYDQYRPTLLEDVLEFMEKHPDTELILDTKSLEEEEVLQKFSQIVRTAEEKDSGLLDRLIPEIYDQEMLDAVESIHSFDKKIYSPYLTDDLEPEHVVDFMLGNGLTDIDLQTDEVSWPLIESLKDNGLGFYIYTCNSTEEAEEYAGMGAEGIMTDFLGPDL